jgi:hypothetical protein
MKINQYKRINGTNLVRDNNYQVPNCNRIYFSGKSRYDFLDEFTVRLKSKKENIIMMRFKDIVSRFIFCTLDSTQKYIQKKASNSLKWQNISNEIFQHISPDIVKIIKMEEMNAKKLGVKASLAYHKDSAEKLICGLINFKEAGYPLPKKVRILESFSVELLKNISKATAFCWLFESNNIGIVNRNDIFSNLEHEMGHYLHSVRDYRLFRYFKFNNIKFKPEYEKLICEEINWYASTNPAEFVADAFRKQVNGGVLSKELLDIYKKLKGPAIKGILRK